MISGWFPFDRINGARYPCTFLRPNAHGIIPENDPSDGSEAPLHSVCNTYARRCVYVGVYVGAHAHKLRARATRIVYIGSILSPPRSFNSSCLSNDCYFLSSPSRYDPSLLQFLLSFLRSRIFQFTILPLFRSSNEHSVFFFFEETTIQIER